jgi:hypothetical protein
MNITAKFQLTEQYFREDFQQSIKYIVKGRKYEPFLCALFIIIGITFLFVDMKVNLISPIAIGIGVFESIMCLVRKRQWLQARMTSSLYNSEVELLFTEQGIRQITSNPENLQERPIVKFLSTEKGIFLWREDGQHIYIPNAAFESIENKNTVVTFLKSNDTANLSPL